MNRLVMVTITLLAAAATFSAATYADVDVIYAGPKTWLQGW
jgi:hypothetical protein